MAEFIIRTNPEASSVDIQASDDNEFIDWMMACEFILHKTAQLSSAGHEKALELLCEGSMRYKVLVEQ